MVQAVHSIKLILASLRYLKCLCLHTYLSSLRINVSGHKVTPEKVFTVSFLTEASHIPDKFIHNCFYHPKEHHFCLLSWINITLSIRSMQISVLHLFLDLRKILSERHGTRTHSPLLSRAFERMTATSQQVKILKLVLGRLAVFFSPLFSKLAVEIRDPTDIIQFTLFPWLPAPLLFLSSEGSVWPPNAPDTLLLFSI